MPSITQGPKGEQAPYGVNKTNLKYILIVVVLAAIVGGGVLAYQYLWAPKEEAKTPEAITPTDDNAGNEKFSDYIYVIQAGKVKGKDGDYTLIKILPDGTGQEEILNANIAGGSNSATRVSPDRKKIYVPGVGIYDLGRKKLIPYKVNQPAGQDCVWFNDSRRLACVYFSDRGELKQTIKISAIGLDGKEEVADEKFVDVSKDELGVITSPFHPTLDILGARNESEVIFRIGEFSDFIKFDLSSKKFSIIHESSAETWHYIGRGDTAVYSNSLDKIVFFDEMKIYTDLTGNEYSVDLFMIDLKTNKTETVYSTGFGDSWRPSHLAISDDNTKVGFEFNKGQAHPLINNKVVVADLTSNQVEIFDFYPFDEERILETPEFAGFSSNPDYLIFNVGYGDINNHILDAELILFAFNTETKQLRKIISNECKADFSALDSEKKDNEVESCHAYLLPNFKGRSLFHK